MNNKKLITVILLLILGIAFTVVFLGVRRTQLTPEEALNNSIEKEQGIESYELTTPEEALNNSIEKEQGIESYELTSTLKLLLEFGDESQKTKGTVTRYKSGNKSRLDYELTQDGKTENVTIFNFPEETFLCSQRMGEQSCRSEEKPSIVEPFSVVNPGDIQELNEEGAVSFLQNTTETKEIAGRECRYMEMDIHLDKIATEFPRDSSRFLMSGSENKVRLSQCLDKSTGIPLQTIKEVNMGEEDNHTFKETVEANSLKTDVNLSEDLFETPDLAD